jgi:DNA ligase-1
MKRFTQLYTELDQTTRTSEKVAALERYFRDVPPADAAWALHLLSGKRLMRAVSTRRLRTWAAEQTQLPGWLVDECYQAVGDLSETLALLLPDAPAVDEPLHQVITRRLLPLADADEATQREHVAATWRAFSRQQRFVFHKLISGSFRVGVSRQLVVRALANVAGIDPAIMAHRLMGDWQPTADDYQRLLAGDLPDDPARPYPFYLASPLEQMPASLGDPGAWLAEWKWDGIRAQLIRRQDTSIIWSRGEEIINASFPEILQIVDHLPAGTVVDGEILAWEDDHPLPFALLQRRIGRKQVQPMLWPDVPLTFMAFDLLERDGRDLREHPQDVRRAALEKLVSTLPTQLPLQLSPSVEFEEWKALAEYRSAARERNAEGIMLKRRTAPYRVGRPRGDWWKWKVDPYAIDAVLIHAQHGHGKRANLFTDYTFGVWHNDELVPVAKAYSGLTDEEIRAVDRFVRQNTIGRQGPFRSVKPELVFELAFEGLQVSERHKSGLALRFPRMARWRHDKQPADADTLATLEKMLAEHEGVA